jgi:putative ABC transport system permease protein
MTGTGLRAIWSRKRQLVSTAIAVVLGVAFLAATMIFGDSAEAGFRDAYTTANAGTDVVVRSTDRIGTGADRMRGLVDASVVDVVAAIDGVADAAPYVEGYAQIVGSDGSVLGGDGPPTLAANWVDAPELNGFRLVEGRAPQPGARTEVVIDRASAERGDLHVGSETSVLVPDRVPVTVVGIAALGDADSIGPMTFVGFDLPTAERLLAGGMDRISSVLVHGDGVTPDALAATIDRRLAADAPGGALDVVTGAQLAAEQQRDLETDFLGLFRTMLVAFAGIAVVVAAFSIHNTFSILVAQRTRESALLRAIGASRRQVLAGVAAEALVVGVMATATGFAAGVGLAAGLQALMARSDLALPDAGLVIGSGPLVASLVVGIGVTLLASLGPAIRASRVAPLAALRDIAVDRSASSLSRAVVGLLLTGAGVAVVLTATASADGALARAGIGALALLVGAVVLGPVVARPAAAVLGLVPATLRGLVGRLARRNAMRNPRRTAASASALMIGTAVVALFTTFAASIKASIADVTDDNFVGDLIVLPDGFSGAELSPSLAPAVARVPGVDTAIGVSYVPVRVDGATVDVAGTDVSRLADVFDVGMTVGAVDEIGRGDVLVSAKYASDHDLSVGSTLSATFVDGATARFSVAGLYTDRMTFGDLVVDQSDVDRHIAQPQVSVVLVDVARGADLGAVRAAVTVVTTELGAPAPLDRAGYKAEVGDEVDGMLFVVYGLLGVAVLIALLAIGNTLSLSIHDRTRELGLLRAVGQDRAQVRATVRWESVVIAVFGTLGGIGAGAFLGWGLMRAMKVQEGFGEFALPVAPLALVVALAAVAGVLAAWRPARRAGRIDILAAIATD